MTPVIARLVLVAVPVAFTFANERSPEKSALPWTERERNGDVVPRPKLPAAVRTEERAPEVL